MTWDAVKARFTAGIAATYAATWGRLAGAIQAAPDTFRARVTAWLTLLTQIRDDLTRAAALLPNPPQSAEDAALLVRYAEQRAMYDALVAGLAQHAVTAPEFGVAPAVVLVIGVLGLTAAGVAWAVASYEYAASLRDQTAYLVRELEARAAAAQSGRPLPPSTASPAAAPTPAPPLPAPPTAWAWLLGGLALAGAAVLFIPRAREVHP